MIIHQKQKRVYRGSGLVWIDDGEPEAMTPEQLYKHWLPWIGSFVCAEVFMDGSGVVETQMSAMRSTILTDDIDSVRVVNQNWRLAFIRRHRHEYSTSFTEETP